MRPYLDTAQRLTAVQASKQIRHILITITAIFGLLEIYSLMFHPNHDTLYRIIALPLILGISASYYFRTTHTTYFFCALLFLNILIYTNYPSVSFIFSYFGIPLLTLMSSYRHILFLGICSLVFCFSGFNSTFPIFWFFTSTAFFCIFYVLPLTLRVIHEQKKSTAHAYANYQARVQEANLSLARELHDTVARHISLINLTAGQALTHSNPPATKADLTTIDVTARKALADLRLLIQTTRDGSTKTALPDQPAIVTDLTHTLTTAVTILRKQGFTVTTDIRITPEDIPTGLHPTLHKLIQEISFNASKYATPSSTISITAKPNLTGITIITSNPVNPKLTIQKKPGTGYGLVGITERITRLGGTITYGTANGTWTLTIHLPIITA